MARPDCREALELREALGEVGLITEADGSGRCRMGETNVVAAVYGPQQARFMRQEEHDRATLDFEVRVCGFSGGEAVAKEKNVVAFLGPVLSGAVCLTMFPRQVIRVTVTVINDDGAAISCALHACVLAFVDAGIDMLALPSSVTMCGYGLSTRDEAAIVSGTTDDSHLNVNHNMLHGSDELELVYCIDPVAAEEDKAVFTMVVAFGDITSADPDVVSSYFVTGEGVPLNVVRGAIKQAAVANASVAAVLRALAIPQ